MQVCRPFGFTSSRFESFGASAIFRAGGSSDVESSRRKILSEPVLSGLEDVRQVLNRLSVNDLSNFELEEMFEEGIHYMQSCSMNQGSKFQVREI